MKRILCAAMTVALAAWVALPAHSQTFNLIGGRGLPHLHSAWTLPKGQFTLHGFGSSYYQTVVKPGLPPTSTTFWNVQTALALHFASGKHVEWAATQVIYQDAHRGNPPRNLPDDLYLGVKIASLGSKVSPLKFGASGSVRVPFARHHNILFEPYSGGGYEIGLMAAASYSPDLLLPENEPNFHVNFGFLHHNDLGKLLTGAAIDSHAVLSPSQEFQLGGGLAIPTAQFDFTFELYGRIFTQRPPVTAYAREDFFYFSPSVIYRPKYWAAFHVGFDFRLLQGRETTRYLSGLPRLHPDIPNYPGWRVNFGVKLNLNQTPPPDNKPLFVSSGGRLVSRQPELEAQLTAEQQKTASAEEELERIRNERKRMEAMLARLRNLLNNEGETPIAPQEEKKDRAAEPAKEKNEEMEEKP
ncbi:MAG: hypothetical protein ONB48_04575 [candidate division KSB1 bacterium]|nr:hypothetical protein [candidate division KSB1 bacterium]MDZ7274414.1 hypothetical protein [candidate division KSB1 bacterium]MDZ7284924.1 hypothetical protein [candidate division KSB1 bacterium]MDZ7297655.1 hypothetical protein [candidate division KSB1 bacterium]MDZ7308612.1 hypothetical protein [candidate division KSB1 bacterium]